MLVASNKLGFFDATVVFSSGQHILTSSPDASSHTAGHKASRLSRSVSLPFLLSLPRLVSECPHAKNDGDCVSLTAAGPSEKPAIYMLISTTAHSSAARSQSADGTSLNPAGAERERGSGEAFVLYVHFCMHYRKWFHIFHTG